MLSPILEYNNKNIFPFLFVYFSIHLNKLEALEGFVW